MKIDYQIPEESCDKIDCNFQDLNAPEIVEKKPLKFLDDFLNLMAKAI